ncbi:hypothetical protein ACF1GS_17830 [Streptomyces eurythermus]|uniref:hypothetical protein n=1 Tax=Streptomyces eurythermus TaxID=42237 RepID=UPI0036FE0A85
MAAARADPPPSAPLSQRGLLIFVRDLDELRILGRTAPNGTRVVVLPEQEPRTQ